jgi:uncharacterized iron-regulated membrane protein
MYFPDEEEPWYIVRLLSAEEPRQVYGKTAVLVSVQTGEVLNDQAAVKYPIGRRLVYALFPLHTGQIAGLSGRILSLLVGIWLLAMMILGLGMYWKRRELRNQRT